MLNSGSLCHELVKAAIAGSAFEVYNNVPTDRQEEAIEAIAVRAVQIARATLAELEDLD